MEENIRLTMLAQEAKNSQKDSLLHYSKELVHLQKAVRGEKEAEKKNWLLLRKRNEELSDVFRELTEVKHNKQIVERRLRKEII